MFVQTPSNPSCRIGTGQVFMIMPLTDVGDGCAFFPAGLVLYR